MTARGQPDQSRSARYVLKDYVTGKLLYCHTPPGYDQEEFHQFAPRVRPELSEDKLPGQQQRAMRVSAWIFQQNKTVLSIYPLICRSIVHKQPTNWTIAFSLKRHASHTSKAKQIFHTFAVWPVKAKCHQSAAQRKV